MARLQVAFLRMLISGVVGQGMLGDWASVPDCEGDDIIRYPSFCFLRL